MPPGDLERNIGELSGQLRMLVPTLERFEVRQLEAEKAAARAGTELEQVRKEVDQHTSKDAENFDELFKTTRGLSKEDERVNGRIDLVKAELAEEKRRRNGFWKRAWEIFMLLASAAVGAVVTKLMG